MPKKFVEKSITNVNTVTNAVCAATHHLMLDLDLTKTAEDTAEVKTAT